MNTKEVQEAIVKNMKAWQQIENKSVAITGQIMEKTENPIVRLVMEIIQRDSQMHYRVQGMIAESLEERVITVTPEDLEAVWDMVEKHIAVERETVRLAKEALEALQGKRMVVQEYLLNYLLIDENKHNEILDTLETIKKSMYPYG